MSGIILTCNNVFLQSDVGKSIQIPGAGAAQAAPLPAHATLLGQILTVTGTVNGAGYYTKVTTTVTATVPGNGSAVWGTDNAIPFQNAINACPAAPNVSNLNQNIQTSYQFTSKGCVLVVPNAGASGTGDYLFGSGITLPSQVSFQLIGMGNASMGQASALAGVRFVTAVPITILTVGNLTPPPSSSSTYGVQNYGGFTLQAISFVDVSFAGAAIGGLLMNGVSEAVIERCSFENFNRQQAGLAASTTALSYGIKATAYGGGIALFNNNIVLLHPKGYNNSIFYDASQGAQDGPIIIGGDIFSINNVNSKPANPPWNGSNTGAGCYGVISSGGVRITGTHFDVSTDHAATHACIGVLTLSAGIISGKFESTSTSGTGVVLGGGGQTSTLSFAATVGTLSKASNGAVTATPTTTNSFQPGQVVTIFHSGGGSDATNFDGNFVVTSSCATPPCTSFTYDYPTGGTASSSSTGTGAPKVSSSVRVDGIFNNMANEVLIDTNASNNTILDMSSGGSNNHVTDLFGGLALHSQER